MGELPFWPELAANGSWRMEREARPDDIGEIRERLDRSRAELRALWGWKHGAHAWPFRNPWLLSWDEVGLL